MTEVVAALIWDQDKFMICQRPAHKARGLLWEFVGGKVEPGETKEQALIRECQEELAITLDVGEVFMDIIHKSLQNVGWYAGVCRCGYCSFRENLESERPQSQNIYNSSSG